MDVDGTELGCVKEIFVQADRHKRWKTGVILVRKCDVMRPEKSADSVSQTPYLFSVSTEQV